MWMRWIGEITMLPARSRRSTGAGLCLIRLALLLAAWLWSDLYPATAAEEASDRPSLRIPITEIDAAPGPPIGDRPGREPAPPKPATPALPAEATARHSLALPDRTLAFTAKTGAVTFEDQGSPAAEIGYFAYLLDGADPAKRPVTFAINGGPGSASAWLHVGVLGPWRLPITQDSASPSAPSELSVNAET